MDTKALLIQAASKLCGEQFQVDQENTPAVDAIATWLARDRNDVIDPNKGILLIGHVGTGKSVLMRATSRVIAEAFGVHAFGVKGCGDLVRAFNEDGYGGEVDRWMNAPHICLDDMGTEGEAIHFGKRTKLIGEIIEARYERAMKGIKAWTHITTNLSTDEIRRDYGDRVYSRLSHICNPIAIGAGARSTDRRKTAPAVKPIVVDADNIYTAIHPDIAARLKPIVEELAAKRRAETAEQPKPAAAFNSEGLLEHFTGTLRDKTLPDLVTLKETWIKEHPVNTFAYSEAMRYVKAIDAEIATRNLKVA